MRGLAALLALVAVLSGCTSGERACTLIAALRGVAVTVDRSLAGDLTTLRLTVCSQRRCVTRPVELQPGTDTVDQGCTGPDPDDTCSATATPNGTRVGFVEIDGLVEGPVLVSGTAQVSGRTQRYAEVTVTAALVFPNGRDCGGGAAQAQVTVSRDGLR